LAKEFESLVEENPDWNQFPLLGDDDISTTPWNPGTTQSQPYERNFVLQMTKFLDD
jgi:hypothetical protein